MDIQSITPSTCIVRNTAGGKGRTTAIAPGTNTASRHLHYGRIILDPGAAAMRVETGDRETGFVCLGGAAVLTVEGAAYALGRYDALYVPRDAAVTIAPGAEGCDLAEIAAPVAKQHPVQHVLFADVRKDPSRYMKGVIKVF